MEQLNCLEGITDSEDLREDGNNLSAVKISEKNFKASRKGLNRQKQNDAEAWKDFWSTEGDFIHRHHIEPRVQLHVPKEEIFPTPLNYIDVFRAAYTNLDVLQQSLIDDYWHIDVDGSSSDSWTGFTKFTLLKEKPPKGYSHCLKKNLLQDLCGPGRRTKIQATTRPDYLWPEIWSSMSKAAQKNAKQEWAMERAKVRKLRGVFLFFEKPKVDNARKLRGIYFMDQKIESKTVLKRLGSLRIHWDILTWPGLRTHIWTCCKKAVLHWRKNFPKDICGREAANKNSSNDQTWLFAAWKMVRHVKKKLNEMKSSMDYQKTKVRQCSKTERHWCNGSERLRERQRKKKP